ncbi:Tn3 family transposase [Streptomyces lavendulocolor]|uniref:Tn3 family transposase n=1 Tax=Streptomyces lavendulocolor TaxID=67316 RepID=UPI0033EBE0DC
MITHTGSYSDLIFGLFAICGYQFPPRIADISNAPGRGAWTWPRTTGCSSRSLASACRSIGSGRTERTCSASPGRCRPSSVLRR